MSIEKSRTEIKIMKRAIFTTVQYNEEALKMLEMTLKSFYLFNSNFDFKVYCLDNSKEQFEKYFNEFKFKNLEFINFKDGTKWNSFLERVKRNDLTDLERVNLFKNEDEFYVFDTSVCISKLEIVDLLLEKYDIVIMSDIDLVYIDSIEDCIKAFLESDKFIAGTREYIGDCKFYVNTGFVIFNSSKYSNNIFDSSIEVLNTNRIKEIYKRQIMYFEQDLLSLITDSKFEIKEIICPIIDKDTRKLDKKFFLIHFAGKEFKPWIDKICREGFEKSIHVHSLAEYKEFYKKVADLFKVDIDVKIIRLPVNYKTMIYKKLMHIFLEKVYSEISQYNSSCSFVAK